MTGKTADSSAQVGSENMKKVAVIVIGLLIALFLANTALAQYVDTSSNIVTAKSSSIDVKIVERTKDSGKEKEYSSDVIDAVSSINETLSNLAPGDEIVLSYKIVNNGSIDVLLDGVNVSVENQDLGEHLFLKWTITQYKDSQPVNSTSNSTNGEDLLSTSKTTDVSFVNIVLDSDNKTDDFCVLELNIGVSDNMGVSNAAKETVFTVTPLFRQY